MAASQLTATRIEAADQILSDIRKVICDECQDDCYRVAVHAVGSIGGEDYKTCLLYRMHLTLSRALEADGFLKLGAAGIIARREQARWLLEHQQTLW
jgi:hypothetical protein